MSDELLDVIVIGAGVVGLAVGAALANAGRSVWVLEAEARAGEGVSSRNSGVIHAGFYYPPGSLKARLCVRGRDLMYDFCARRGIGHRRLGKLLVATHETEVPKLHEFADRAARNGVVVHWRTGEEARALEPALNCAAALESPDSGIVDVPEFVVALEGELERAGGMLVNNVRVAAVHRDAHGFIVETTEGDRVAARTVVNAAGLGSIALAHTIEGLAKDHVPALYYGAGHYYTVRGRVPFTRLIYPLPEPGGLGVHLGFDPAGRPRFGPDLRYRDTLDYTFDDAPRARFAASIRQWWPALRDEDLQPDFVGVRPKLVPAGVHNPDFMIQDASVHGIDGLINLFGIESPGLTSSMGIGEEVRDRLRASFEA